MILGARQSLWDTANKKLPYIDFNVDGDMWDSTYFNTGYVLTSKSSVETLFGKFPYYKDPDSSIYNRGHQHGCRNGWVYDVFQIVVNDKNTMYDIWPAFNNDSSFSQGEIQFNNSTTFKCKLCYDGKFYLNDQLIHDYHENFVPNGQEYYIGDVNEDGYPKGFDDCQGQIRYHYTKIYESDVLVRYYEPFIDTDGVIKLKDNITNQIIQQSHCDYGTRLEFGIN